MKRIIAVILCVSALFGLLSGCESGGSKIKLEDANYALRSYDIQPSATLTADMKTAMDGCVGAISKAMEAVPSDAYTFDFSTLASTLGISQVDCEAYMLPELEKISDSIMVSGRDMHTSAIWAVRAGDGFEDDIKAVWINVYENLDGDEEYVIDISRSRRELYTIRYVERNGTFTEKDFSMSPNFDGESPADQPPLTAEESGHAGTMYFSGRVYKTGIFELPVLGPVDMNIAITATAVEGEIPGGFAGMLQGSVNIDGHTDLFITDGFGIEIPTSLVDDPSQYYIGITRISTANPQDTVGYRNFYIVKKDFTEIVGIYEAYKAKTTHDWFEFSRVSKSTYDANVKENNEKITRLYSDVTIAAYGSRKEYNYSLAVLYNMMIGVDRSYLEKNMKTQIADVSKDIREYASALQDENMARLGENGLYFFPDARSMVVRLFSYDGETAIAAIDFSSKQDDGYGGLYKATYADGKWQLEVLKGTRISSESTRVK